MRGVKNLMKKETVRNFILFAVVTTIVWNICDFIYCSFITHTEYVFTAGNSVLKPFISGLLFFALYYYFPLRKK